MIGSWLPLGGSAAGLVLRATVLLAGAALFAWALRRGAAGTRHVLWTATFVALLALPLGTIESLRWDLPVLPAAVRSPNSVPAPETAGRPGEPAAYDLEGRVGALEREIEDYDLEGRVRELEREIEELDAERRAAAIERDVEPEVEALRRLIDGM